MSISISISEQMDNITTTIFQNTADQMFTGVIDLTALNYKKNVGHLMLALLLALGFVCSDDGKTLSHSSNPTAKLNWCKPASKGGSRKAADVARPTLLGQLQGLDLTHDDGMPRPGSRAAQTAAAAAARPPRRGRSRSLYPPLPIASGALAPAMATCRGPSPSAVWRSKALLTTWWSACSTRCARALRAPRHCAACILHVSRTGRAIRSVQF